jgi:glutathione peroxidase
MGLFGCCKSKTGAGVSVAIFAGVYVAVILPLANRSSEKDEQAMVETVSLDVESGHIEQKIQEKQGMSTDVLGYTIEMIDGSKKSLEDYRGKVLMFVNVASACGLTPQYEGLEAMYQEYKDDGLVIIGFPANEFGAQEPGSNAEIAQFCSNEYGVTFPMAAKVVVKGEGIHPLYAQLAAQPEPIGGEPEWNFAKYLVNREGGVVERFPSRTAPVDVELVAAVEVLLGEE